MVGLEPLGAGSFVIYTAATANSTGVGFPGQAMKDAEHHYLSYFLIASSTMKASGKSAAFTLLR